MTSTLTDLDQINADIMTQGATNPFAKDIEPGTAVSGVIIAVIRRHRRNSKGQLLYWVDRKPMTTEAGDPVIDSQLVLEIEPDAIVDEQDEGLRLITLDRDIQRALRAGLRQAKVAGVAIGGQITGLTYIGPVSGGGYGRIYELEGYTAPTT